MRPGIPLAVAALPPLHEFYLHRTMPRRRLPGIAPQCATRYSAKPILLGRRLSAARLASYRPNETRKLTRDRSDGDRLELASPDQRSVAPVETALRLPGESHAPLAALPRPSAVWQCRHGADADSSRRTPRACV